MQEALKRAEAAALSWPLPAELTADVLEQKLFARAGVHAGARRHQELDWATLAVDVKRSGVTLMLLWKEYRAAMATAASATYSGASSGG